MIPVERIVSCMYLIRGEKVMLDQDLAELYGVMTGNLNKTVKRNLRRFPDDFMFQLTEAEWESLLFQIGIAKQGRGGRRSLPYVFTEQGVAMLSSVLHSDRAAEVNVTIMRTFVRMREMLATNKELAQKVEQPDKDIAVLHKYVTQLLDPATSKNARPIGYI
ncbi:MAG: ORF6N domain-containing protein [Nitrospirales bacterium]|nr:ORF6N domain-containing protein [Nitrospirales bacterium]